MPRKRSLEAQTLYELETALTKRLEEIQEETLARVSAISGVRSRSLQSFHGQIGGKNNTFVDSIRTKFTAPQDFKARWLHGLTENAKKGLKWGEINSAGEIARLLQDELVREYTFAFLERNFYRNLVARTRDKPDESLWGLWFGDNKMPWGLIIAPVLREGEWTNDVSEIRRAGYKYWTVGHVLETGLLDPETQEPVAFHSLGDLVGFYRSVLQRVSQSLYEKAVADRYVAYLEDSDDYRQEPFLIPELRYAGRAKHHEHRLDFSVLNAHTMEFVGFEFSPHSTHGAVEKAKEKTQAQLNKELAARWAKEMKKRNDYFQTFGIATITFTDDDLVDMDACFSTIRTYLSKRGEKSHVLSTELAALDELDFSGAVSR